MVVIGIILATVILGIFVWLFIREIKNPAVESQKVENEVVSEPSKPSVDEVPTEQEKEPEKLKEELKPKFKVDDWIVSKLGNSWHIDSFDKKNYQLSDGKGNYSWLSISKQDEMHLWTIQDAKKGDVLVSELCESIILFRGIKDNNIDFYCDYYFSKIDILKDRFAVNNGQHYGNVEYSEDFHPTTKEQRDLLFQKMKEAGYEWDSGNKQLISISVEQPKEEPKEEKPTLVAAKSETKVKTLQECIDAFKDYVTVLEDSSLRKYLYSLYDEAWSQFSRFYEYVKLPLLYKKENFPNITNLFNGSNEDKGAAFNTLVGWLFALQLVELIPRRRNQILKIGYELGGYNYSSPIYGYTFESDPNVARMVASMIYVGMRGKCKPNITVMRSEVRGTQYPYPLAYYLDMGLNHLKTSDDIKNNVVSKGGFYVDLREFMPSSAGPFAPDYNIRPDKYIKEARDVFGNIAMDGKIHEFIVSFYNLDTDDPNIKQQVVQAIADKEQSTNHLFGGNKKVGNYEFHPVFGADTIGKVIPTNGATSLLTYYIQAIGTYFRLILQNKVDKPAYYGRLRPGCSWSEEKKKNSDTDDRRNVLVEIAIEDNDGEKESIYGYYDTDGIWKHTIVEREKFAEEQKNHLGANSYPSGHSSGIWTVAMMLAEVMPDKADLIMKTANQFAINRTITRFHWTSDTIFGRVLGGVANAMCHATNDYDTQLKSVKKELGVV